MIAKKIPTIFGRLQQAQVFQFATQQQILENAGKLTQKLKMKQTVADKKKLQSYLHKTQSKGRIIQDIDRTSKYNEEFQQFLKEYNAKNKQFPNIIDMSSYVRESNLYNKPQDLRKDEILMLEEFRKRKQEALSLGQYNESQQAVNDEDNVNSVNHLKLNLNDDFITLLIENDVTTLTTKLNRVNHFRYLVFMGNANGVIGYGKGKGNDFESALENAILHCKKNLISVPLDHFMSLPQELSGKYNDIQLKLMPRANFNPWGNPVLASMILLTGVTHCGFKLTFRNMNPYAMVYCYFKLITQNMTPQELCERKGVKVYRESFSKPVHFNHMPYLRL